LRCTRRHRTLPSQEPVEINNGNPTSRPFCVAFADVGADDLRRGDPSPELLHNLWHAQVLVHLILLRRFGFFARLDLAGDRIVRSRWKTIGQPTDNDSGNERPVIRRTARRSFAGTAADGE
jgi:hypothetical protein